MYTNKDIAEELGISINTVWMLSSQYPGVFQPSKIEKRTRYYDEARYRAILSWYRETINVMPASAIRQPVWTGPELAEMIGSNTLNYHRRRYHDELQASGKLLTGGRPTQFYDEETVRAFLDVLGRSPELMFANRYLIRFRGVVVPETGMEQVTREIYDALLRFGRVRYEPLPSNVFSSPNGADILSIETSRSKEAIKAALQRFGDWLEVREP